MVCYNIGFGGFEGESQIGIASSIKGSTPKREEFSPSGNRFFPFRVDLFQKGLVVHECEQEVTKVVSLLKTAKKNNSLPSLSSPF